MAPLMSIWRNFWLGSEPTTGWGPLRRLDVRQAKKIAIDEMRKMGIDVRIRAAGRDAVGWRAAVRGDLQSGVLRRQGADPR